MARSVGATAAATWEQNARGTPGVKKNGWVTGYLARANRGLSLVERTEVSLEEAAKARVEAPEVASRVVAEEAAEVATPRRTRVH